MTEVCGNCLRTITDLVEGLPEPDRGNKVRQLVESVNDLSGGCNALCLPLIQEIARGNGHNAVPEAVNRFNPYCLEMD